MPNHKDIEGFCRSHLSPYAHKDSVKNDIVGVLKNFAELDVSKGQFYEPNGQCRDLVKLHGTIPIHFKGNVYHIPVCLWLDHQHPYRAPTCLVEPTSTMHVKPGKHVDSNGLVYLPYLHEWRHPNSDILNLIQVLQLQFGEECPVFSRPVGAPPPAARPPPGRPAPPRAPPSYPPHGGGGAAYQPPPVGGGGYPGPAAAGPGYSSMPRPGQPQPYGGARGPQPYGGARGPQPPYPSQAPAGGYPSRQPYPAASSSAPYPGGPSPYPNSAPYPGAGAPRQPQPGYPTGAAPYPGGPVPGQAPYPGSQPGYPGGGGGGGGGGGPAPGYPGASAAGASPGYPVPQPPYPVASSSNSSYPNGTGPSNPYSTYPPPGQASPGAGTSTTNSSQHNSIMSTTPAGYGAAMVTEQLRGNNDEEAGEDIRRRSLVSGVEDKLRRRLQATIDTAQIETRELETQQSDLRAGAERLDRVMNQLQSLQTEAESNIAVMTTKSAELQDVLQKLDENSGNQLDVDEAVVATYPLYTQMVALIAEDNAIEDTVYYLGEALRKKVVPLDVFLRYARDLSTRQYIIRATLQKAQGVAEF